MLTPEDGQTRPNKRQKLNDAMSPIELATHTIEDAKGAAVAEERRKFTEEREQHQAVLHAASGLLGRLQAIGDHGKLQFVNKSVQELKDAMKNAP